MKKTETKPTCVHRRPAREAAVEDYAWRFGLVRSTLEDFNQLNEDRNGGSDTKRPATSLPAMQGEIPPSAATQARLCLTTMAV
ncbi:MAG TPA: hypothetical protein VN887_09070 [Candidatus Angelobacter sp.]|nr:hypothetical protein [Candidatus Angelobacter sp.]